MAGEGLHSPITPTALLERDSELDAVSAVLDAARADELFQPDRRAGGSARSLDREDEAFALMHGLYWLTANLADRTPLLIAVDDAHWVDGPTLRFLHYLAQRLAGLPVAVALAR